jgi:putative restriction endonuclease
MIALVLDAAHIVADKDEQLGQPVVPNGIPLSKIPTRPQTRPYSE